MGRVRRASRSVTQRAASPSSKVGSERWRAGSGSAQQRGLAAEVDVARSCLPAAARPCTRRAGARPPRARAARAGDRCRRRHRRPPVPAPLAPAPPLPGQRAQRVHGEVVAPGQEGDDDHGQDRARQGRDQHREPGSEQGNDAGVAAHVVPVEDAGVEVPLAEDDGSGGEDVARVATEQQHQAQRRRRGSRDGSTKRPPRASRRASSSRGWARLRNASPCSRWCGTSSGRPNMACQARTWGSAATANAPARTAIARTAAARPAGGRSRLAELDAGQQQQQAVLRPGQEGEAAGRAAPGRGTSHRGGVGRFAQPQVGPEGQGRGAELEGMRHRGHHGQVEAQRRAHPAQDGRPEGGGRGNEAPQGGHEDEAARPRRNRNWPGRPRRA